MPSNAPYVQHSPGGRTAARKGEKIDHLPAHVVFEYALDRARVRPRSSPEVSTRWRCVWILEPISASLRARVTHNNPKACFMLVLVCVETSPLTLALHVAQMACFCQCQPAARMHSISAPNQPPVRPSVRPSRLGAKSNRTINQKKDEAAVSFYPPHMVRRVHLLRRTAALSRLIYLARSPFLSSPLLP